MKPRQSKQPWLGGRTLAFIRKLADEATPEWQGGYAQLTTLTKTIGPRLSGSPGFYRAEVWGQQSLREAGAGKIWLQECLVPHWVRGGRDSAIYTSLENKSELKMRTLDILALGNSKGTGPEGIRAPAVLIHSFEELKRRSNEVKGKIVYFDYPFDPRQIETFRAYADAVRYRVQGASNAARYGAVGVLIRSVTNSLDNNPHTGSMTYNDSFPEIPAAAIGLQDADRLAAALQNNGQVSVYLRTMGQMLPDTLAHNVIGEIRGSEVPGEVIVVSGHLDSWDPAEGAQDDGAGCVHSIEVLRALEGHGV